MRACPVHRVALAGLCLALLGTGCGGEAPGEGTEAPGASTVEDTSAPSAQGRTSEPAPEDDAGQEETPAPAPQGPPGDGMTERLNGVLRAEGQDPWPRLVLVAPEGERVVLAEGRESGPDPGPGAGPVLAELNRLEGATVRVFGRRTPRGDPLPEVSSFLVERYEILAIEGERPLVGRIARDEEDQVKLVSDDGASLGLEGLPTAGPGEGDRVWILGDLDDGRVRVRAFGLVRPAAEGSNPAGGSRS